MTITDKQVEAACSILNGRHDPTCIPGGKLFEELRAALEAAEAARDAAPITDAMIDAGAKVFSPSGTNPSIRREVREILSAAHAAPSGAEQAGKPGSKISALAEHSLPQQATPSAPADERSRFEAFWKKRCLLLNQPSFLADRLRPERYFDGPTQAAWEGWRARAQASEPVSAQAAATVVESTDDPREFGAGIVVSPGMRYWQKRCAEWMDRAVALGWHQHRDACQEAGKDPDATPPSGSADAREGELAALYREFYDTVADHFGCTHGAEGARDGDPWWHGTDAEYLTRETVAAIEIMDRARLDAKAAADAGEYEALGDWSP